VRSQNEPDLWRKSGQPPNRCCIRIQISFGAEEPDWSGIVSITREEKSVGAIDQGNSVRRMARGCDHLYSSTAKVEAIAVVSVGCNPPRTCGVEAFASNPLGKVPQIWSGVISACASSREPSAFLRVKSVSTP